VYKLLLCWRYLRTRRLALVCIVSVLLGVATLIVVNSVMAGFSTKLKERLHGLLSDVVIESYDTDGFADAEGKIKHILADPVLGDRIAALAPTLEIFAIVQFNYRDTPIMRPVRLVGVPPERRAAVGGFAEHLLDPENRVRPSFDLRGEALENHQKRRFLAGLHLRGPDPVAVTAQLPPEIWWQFHQEAVLSAARTAALAGSGGGLGPLLAAAANPPGALGLSEAKAEPVEPIRSPAEPPAGIFLGHSIAHFPDPQTHEDVRTVQLGDPVSVLTLGMTPMAGRPLDPVNLDCVAVDYSRTEMSEYDANYVYVPLDYLQRKRHMEGRATHILIRLKDYQDAKMVVGRLQAMFKGHPLTVQTWEEKQGPLLAAIRIEKGILNVLLFLIIAVAGFGILAIFSMIVIEKTRDIGILKALGASNGGVMKIFLGYGLLLGLVGAGLGTTLGLTFTTHINAIEKWLSRLTGMEVFDRKVYYFKEIPTDIQPLMVLYVNLGAVAIAVLFSVLPALRAALLHPVRALRYE
jgi:lipoprotein-releasing system permease protein